MQRPRGSGVAAGVREQTANSTHHALGEQLVDTGLVGGGLADETGMAFGSRSKGP